MSFTKHCLNTLFFIAVVSTISIGLVHAQTNTATEEITVWGQGRPVDQSHRSSSTVLLSQEDLVSINPMTTEDLLKFEPSLIIRQRFIGDPNGTMGLRTASMFQTSRTSVYADGVPLHYFLQTSFNGSPRWALVGANEVGTIELVYGPFSAEYGGNAMGGVVNFETKIPTKREFHLEGSMFQNDFSEVGFADKLNGRRIFGSYGDKFGNLSLYSSWIHLENDSHPMDYRFSNASNAVGNEPLVTGGIPGKSSTDTDVINYGDTGVQAVNSDQFKVKLGYDFGDWFTLFNVAYENRVRDRDAVNNYLLGTNGQAVWNGNFRTPDGRRFNVARANFTEDESDRQNILLAGRLQGPLTDAWWLEMNFSYYEMMQDETRSSLQHPSDPTFTPVGRIRDYDDTGWKTADIKLETDELLGRDDLELVTGYQYANYSMSISDYDSPDYRGGVFGALRNSSGGETVTHSLFAQLGWDVTEQWDIIIGGRQEFWQGNNGFVYDYVPNPDRLRNGLDLSVDKFSPKFSVGYTPGNDWQFRYSLAKAYRFPIVEELYSNATSTTGTSLANAGLAPEDGLHHNLMVERGLDNGYVRVNFLYETIKDVIFSQSVIVNNATINTFLPVDEVETWGSEVVLTQNGLFDGNLDARFNLTWMNSDILQNSLNPAIEGNDFPRLPTWRGNLVLTYHITDDWDFGGGVRYVTGAFQQLDNSDIGRQTYAVMDKYTLVNLKSNYNINEHVRVSLAVDNLFNKLAYVNHPYPMRTIFLETSLDY